MASWIRRARKSLTKREEKVDDEARTIEQARIATQTEEYWTRVFSYPGNFKHEPLDTNQKQIRLMQLWYKPCTEEWMPNAKPFSCTIETFDVGKAPPYIALSYTWGPLINHNIITLNGERFAVRENLLSFLKTFSDHPECFTYHIWIDQVCIDQRNTTERNHQVGLMSEIYENSTFVIAWLGEDAQAAAERLKSKPSASCIQQLLDNVYFTRLWIVQEVLIGKSVNIVCGEKWIQWDTLRNAILSLTEAEFERLPPAKWLFHMKEEKKYSSDHQTGWRELQLSLYEAMSRYASLDCENPRDKIFGLTSLIDSEKYPIPNIDYSKSLEEVYFEAMNVMLQTPGLLTQEQMVTAIQNLGPKIGLSKQFVKDLEQFFIGFIYQLGKAGGTPDLKVGYEVDEEGQAEWWFEVDRMNWWYDKKGKFRKPYSGYHISQV